MRRVLVFLAAFLLLSSAALAGPTYDDPEKAAQIDPDFAVQGEYAGTIETDEGDKKFGVQVIALGGGKFRAVAYHGGLPGDGWNGGEKHTADGERQGEEVIFQGEAGRGVVKGNAIAIHRGDGDQVGELKKVERKSPTLGKEPPEGATVLFNGAEDRLESWQNGRLTKDGLLMPGVTSKKTFGDHTIHIEFRLPYQPQDAGQARGNSGIYVQGRYEVQMLDSFGLEGKQNECGGIYTVKDPDLNMCFPPLAWQTYDIDYTAARYDESGHLKFAPRITVRHNGVLIHDGVELPGDRNTTAAPVQPGPHNGPLYLQDHGNPVRYRNIWVVEK